MAADQKDKRLIEFLQNGKDWERKQTNIPGVFLIRLIEKVNPIQQANMAANLDNEIFEI